ncbi:anthranilate phosphoribosyltransferase [Pichia kudriavzevii]|uniref:Anthranilate phosphoribosyltransferase n=1 Tax=Pichia kudriavzevii TaxID=4909 RepID=A0A1Z8JNT7_PICKU|nr:anthranilate phosphoribosyltransferase [Pichia kudriavzevii]
MTNNKLRIPSSSLEEQQHYRQYPYTVINTMSKPLTVYIKKLVVTPPELTLQDFAAALDCIFSGNANDVEISSFLTALRIHKLDFNADFIATAVETILKYSEKIPDDQVDSDGYVDIVGTGGDSQNTFNVSTSAAIVAAGMGVNVCKHGGKASTSASGSGDLMNQLGVELMKVTSKSAPLIVKESKLCFLFAPAFHHGMGQVVNVRKQLGIPTIFNILGPLLNPINIKARILGVYTKELGRTYCEAAVKIDRANGKRANTMVVCGEVGLDEISPIGRTNVWYYNKEADKIEEFTLTPEDFGLPEHSLDLVRSGTPIENAVVLKEILKMNKEQVQPGINPLVDYIFMNAGALAVVSGLAQDWKHGVELAREAVYSGKAQTALDEFISSIYKYT